MVDRLFGVMEPRDFPLVTDRPEAPADTPGGSFQNLLEESLSEVNDLQHYADDMVNKLATNEVKDLHQVLAAVEEANLAFKLTMKLRDKIMEAYREVMRMSI